MGSLVTSSTTFGFGFSGVHDGFEKRTGRQNYCASSVERITRNADAGDFSVYGFEGFNSLLTERQVLLQLDPILHFELVSLLVCLGSRTMHRRTFTAVEHAKMNARLVDNAPHLTAERVDLADDLPFGDATDSRVAAHLTDRVAVHRQQRGLCSHPRGRQCGLCTGMASTDNNNIKIVNAFVGHDASNLVPVFRQSVETAFLQAHTGQLALLR